jgi:aspartyl-tRNA(Asn)/glutamyl-tRNA(Gln) amidotransferase subunit A
MTNDLFYLSAEELIRNYRSRERSPVEVMRAILQRIDAVNPTINALYFVDADRSLAAAKASEERWQRGQPVGLLDGVPVTLKDHIPARGTLSFYGTNAVNAERAPDAVDAPVAARLKEAGAIIVGKTTMPDFGLIPTGISSRLGVTRNPWNLTRNSGGSSSGAAAALATGLGPLAVGSDGGGSVRIPSAFCGVFGLKPSYGRVPLHDPAPWIVAGPMTRSAGDAALMMNVITRPDAQDFSALPYDARDYRESLNDGVRGARIGLLEDIGFGLKIDPQIQAKLMEAARVFESLGAVVEPIPPLFSENPEPHFDRLLHIRTYFQFSTMTQAQQDSMLPVLAHWCRQENAEPRQTLAHSLVSVEPIRRATLAPFVEYEFVLAPVMAVLPFAADQPWTPGGTAHNPFCFPFNMSEQPAGSIHGGFSSDGLPVGLQIIGRRFDDRGVLRAAHAYDQATGFLARRPGL